MFRMINLSLPSLSKPQAEVRLLVPRSRRALRGSFSLSPLWFCNLFLLILSWPRASFLRQARLASLFQRLGTTHGCAITQVNRIFQNHVALSSSRKSQCGFRTFSTSEDLSAKKCVPCSAKDLRPMTEETANELISKVPEWNLVNESGVLKLNRSWKVKTFLKGLELFRLVAEVAESEGHHPDLHLVGWNNVTIEIWTHAVGGLTENDFILAAKINGLPLQDLLRRKAKS